MKINISIFTIAAMILLGIFIFSKGGVMPVLIWVVLLIAIPILFKKLNNHFFD